MGDWTETSPDEIKRIRKVLKELNSLEAQAGWFETAVYPDGTPTAYVAATQEEGNPARNIPPRSFMRSTEAEQGKTWNYVLKSGVDEILEGVNTPRQVLTAVGALASGDIRKKITQIYSPPLALSTLKARYSRASANAKKTKNKLKFLSIKPLVDTRHLLNTCTQRVVKKS